VTASDTPAPFPMLEVLRDHIAVLSEGAAQEVLSGHLDLGPDLWLSCDPAGQTRMQINRDEAGLRLEIDGGDSGGWTCLGMRLQPAELARARHVGLLLSLRSAGMVSYRPTLRYFKPEGGFQDVATTAPVVLLPGARENLAYIPIDQALATRATGCEFNLFFLEDGVRAEALHLEPVLMA